MHFLLILAFIPLIKSENLLLDDFLSNNDVGDFPRILDGEDVKNRSEFSFLVCIYVHNVCCIFHLIIRYRLEFIIKRNTAV